MTLSVPAWCRAAIRDTHSAEWIATLYPADGSTPVVLPITAGSLRADSDSWPRWTAQVSLGDLSLAPTSPTSDVTPFGARLTLDYVLSDSTGQTITLRAAPTMLVDTVNVGRGRSVGMTITASDPSLAIATDAYAVPSSLPTVARTVSSAIEYLIRRTFPSASILDTVNSGAYVGNGYAVDGDPWAAIESLADSIGADCYVDTLDRFVVTPTPAIGIPLDELRTGPGGTVVGTSSTVIRGYNRVAIAFRDEQGRVVVGRWADESGGPLDIDGPYGRVTYTEARDREATPTQADLAASRLARRAAGKVRDVEVEAVAAPWIQCGDTVGLVLPAGTDTLVVRSIEHDLSGVEPSFYRFRTDTVGPV
jgi:hypothetical protein